METEGFFLSITLPSLSLYIFYPHTCPLPPFTTFLPSLFHLSLHSSTFPLPPVSPFLYLPSSTGLSIPLPSLFHLSLHSSTCPVLPFTPFLYLPSSTFHSIPLGLSSSIFLYIPLPALFLYLPSSTCSSIPLTSLFHLSLHSSTFPLPSFSPFL